MRVGVLLLLALAPFEAQAADLSATATGQAQAEVVAPLVVTRLADLDFGSIFATMAAGTVTVGATGTASYGGGVQAACAGADCAAAHAAAFAVAGEPGRSYAITVPVRVIAHGTGADPAAGPVPDLAVEDLVVASQSRPAENGRGSIDQHGQDRFTVGGTLVVPAGLRAGRYRATIDISVDYS